MSAFAGECIMDLLLWRHAEAEDGPVDFDRALTDRGQKQARAMARWLRKHAPKKLRIIASPTVRTRQTADAIELPYETSRRIGPGKLKYGVNSTSRFFTWRINCRIAAFSSLSRTPRPSNGVIPT